MAVGRTFSVCQGCGTWRETAKDLNSFFADYDMPFFIEHHMARCPITGKPEALVSISESDENFRQLSPEKQWRPESFAGYRPKQEPKFERYSADLACRLPGVWNTSNLGGHSDETLVLWPEGNAALDFYNVAFCGREIFRWKIEGPDYFRTEPGEVRHYFRVNPAYFEIGCFTNNRGEHMEVLRIFAEGREKQPIEFFKSSMPLEEYLVPTPNSY